MNKTAMEMFSCLNRLQNIRIRPPSIGDLHSNEIGILIYLKHNKNLEPTVSQISNAFGVTRSSITQQVNRLEALGYVIKRTDENDRRSVFISLTIKGAGILLKLDRGRQNNIEHLAEFLGEADAKELTRLLQRVTEYKLQKQKQE